MRLIERITAAISAFRDPPEDTAETIAEIRRTEWESARRHIARRLRAMATELDMAAGGVKKQEL